MIPTLSAARYITPLREGGSLPAIVQASDGQLYVMKFSGAALFFHFCRTLRFLDCRVHLDVGRLAALAPGFDSAAARVQLDLTPLICAGGPAVGPVGELDQAERFRWLTSPRSTVLQISPVHCGLGSDPQAALDDLFDRLVMPPAPGTST